MKDGPRPELVLLATVVLAVGTNAYIIAPASIAPVLVAAFDIGKVGAGTAISAAILGSVVVQLPGGVLMDRYDNRRLMFAAVIVFVAAAATPAFVPSYPALLASRFVGGMMVGFTYTMSASIVGQLFPGRRGTAMSTFVASAPAGFALAQFATPLLAARFGWPSAFVAFGLITAAGYAGFRAVAVAPIRNDHQPSLGELVTAVSNRSILLVALSSFCANALYLFLNSWMPTYANEVLGIPLAGAGALAALVPLTGILARPGGGWLSDAVGGRRRPVIVASLLFVPPLLLSVSRAGSLVTYAAVLLLAGFAIQFSTGVYFAFTQELAPPDARGTSLTVYTTLAFTGSLVAPFVGGWSVDALGWGVTFGLATVVALAGATAVFVVSEPGKTGTS